MKKHIRGLLKANGRPKTLNGSSGNKLVDHCVDAAEQLNAVKAGQEFEDLFNDIAAQEAGNNSYVKTRYSESTYRNYIKTYKLKKVLASLKNKTRRESYNNIRNPISLCSVLEYVNKRVTPEQMYSTDETSVLLYKDCDTIQVITKKEAIDKLKEYNTGNATSGDMPQQRVVTFNCTISGGNKLVCTVVKIADRNFLKDGKPTIDIVKVEEGLYVCMNTYGIDDTKLNKIIYKACIVKCVNEDRESNIKRNIDGLQFAQYTHGSQSQSQSSQHGIDIPAPPMTEEAIREKYKYCALFNDGAYGQLNAQETSLIPESVQKALCFIYVKFAAGCSMIQQPNDVGHMHRILKLLFHSKKFRFGHTLDPEGVAWVQRKEILDKRLSGPSFKTFWRCMCHLKLFRSKAFNEMNINHAWADAGILPFDPRIILSACPHFRKLNQLDADRVMECLPRFAELVETKGMVEETDYKTLLGEIANADNCGERNGKPLNDMTTSRQRATVVSHPTFFASAVNKAANIAAQAAMRNDIQRLRQVAENAAAVDGELIDIATGGASSGAAAAASSSSTSANITGVKKKRTNMCANGNDTTKHESQKKWRKCTHEGCKAKFCLRPECNESYTSHCALPHL